MRFLTLIAMLAVVLLSGCNGERSQAAADAREGIAAAAPHADETGKAILQGVDLRLPAASGVPSANWPKPTVSAAEIEKDPAKYIRTAPPEPKGWWIKISLGAVASLPVLLLIAKTVFPLVPGIGPLAEGVANMAYALFATKNQRAADNAREMVHDHASILENLIDRAKVESPSVAARIPPQLDSAITLLAKT